MRRLDAADKEDFVKSALGDVPEEPRLFPRADAEGNGADMLTSNAELRKDVIERHGLDAMPDEGTRRWFGLAGSRSPLAQSSHDLFVTLAKHEVAAFAKDGGISITQAAKTVVPKMQAENRVERAGRFFWQNYGTGIKSTASLLAMPPDKADQVINDLADAKFKQAGFAKGAYGDNYTATRAVSNGHSVWHIVGYDEGQHAEIIFTDADLRAAKVKALNSKRPLGYNVAKSRAGPLG